MAFDIMKATNNYYCNVEDIEEIKITIKELLDGKGKPINYDNYEKFNANNVMKKYDSFKKKQ